MVKLQLVNSDVDLPSQFGEERGSAFGWNDRWQVGTTIDGKHVTDYSDWEARDIYEMFAKDYKARQIESVLTLPIMSAEYGIHPIKGDTGESEWLNNYWNTDSMSGGCRTSLFQIIGLCTSAFFYKRAYFEIVWGKGVGEFEGKNVYIDVAFRPQTTCRIMREPITGRFAGFQQQPYYMGGTVGQQREDSLWPIEVEPPYAFVYTHGTRRDPLNGVSDAEVAFWAWKTKQKILLLWFQFLQSVALPRITVKANDGATANKIAQEISRMKGSGVLPVAVPGGPDSVGIDLLDASGKGAEQFQNVITWLDSAATQSILAGFLDLTSQAASGKGSYALSSNASDFFLQSLEAKTRELEDQIRENLFAPLIRANFGPNAKVPRLQFEPLNDIDKETAVSLLQAAMAMPPGGPVPTSFISGLAEQVSDYIGLDGEQMKKDFEKSFDEAQTRAREQADALQNAQQAAATPPPGSNDPTAQEVASLSKVVDVALSKVAEHRPVETHASLVGAARIGHSTASARREMYAMLKHHQQRAAMTNARTSKPLVKARQPRRRARAAQ